MTKKDRPKSKHKVKSNSQAHPFLLQVHTNELISAKRRNPSSRSGCVGGIMDVDMLLIWGLIQGKPRMSFPHFIVWKVSLWMILINKEAIWVTCPFSFGVPPMMVRGFSSFRRLCSP